MLGRARHLASSLWERFERLPLGLAIAVGVVIFGGFTAAGVWGYRTWDYIENDNAFCLDCHLMAEPFELFGESAHRDMSCKACHNPNMLDRTKMGLTQVVKNPDSLTVHAEVTNEACASCHVFGNPDEWNLIARSSGHRVHMESTDPELDGLMCVECHSTSVHQFQSTDATCRECHEGSDIVMTGMHDVAMNCGSCHNFNAPIEEIPVDEPLIASPEGALETALTPGSEECLGCHLMRSMVEFDTEDPHEAMCGSCHNPHSQDFAEDAIDSCATAGCHEEPAEELSPYHAGLGAETLADCAECHEPHSFHADGEDCLSCHADVFNDASAPRATEGGAPVPPLGLHGNLGLVGRVARSVAAHGGKHGLAWRASATAHPRGSATAHGLADPDSTFRHAQHRSVDCLSCHAVDTSHGEVTITPLAGCRSCHHSAPEADDCSACHEDSALAGRTFSQPVVLNLSTGEPLGRVLPFDHGPHAGEECATCHTEGTDMSVASVDCTGCHEEHHAITVQCSRCHTPSPRPEHAVEAHVGCGGSDCHADVPFQGVPRQRQLCLVCHVEQVDHQVASEESCADCHALPEPGSPAGVGP